MRIVQSVIQHQWIPQMGLRSRTSPRKPTNSNTYNNRDSHNNTHNNTRRNSFNTSNYHNNTCSNSCSNHSQAQGLCISSILQRHHRAAHAQHAPRWNLSPSTRPRHITRKPCQVQGQNKGQQQDRGCLLRPMCWSKQPTMRLYCCICRGNK